MGWRFKKFGARMTPMVATFIAAGTAIFVNFFPFSGSMTSNAEAKDGVVSIGGSVTEIVYALGQQERLVARDSTSSYPPAAEDLADVGYMRALSAEGVLSVNPALIISEAGSGPPAVIDVLQSAGVKFVMLDAATDGSSIGDKIRAVGDALNVPDLAAPLATQIEDDMARAVTSAAKMAGDNPKRVLFILSTQGGRIMASGSGTSADAMILLAGGVNAVEGMEGYKTLSEEAVSRAAPDAIVMMDRGGDHGVADDVLFSMPAIKPTPAAETETIIRMNGLLLLGFGPRTPGAIETLSTALYGAH
jgi:iron complex transport system substrate-binding protein